MKYAPFVVPTLCRSEHFIRMMESLKKNSWACFTDVIVSVDFPPSEEYRKGWQEICDYLGQGDFSVFNKLIVLKQSENLGFGRNSSFLYKYVAQNYDRFIRCDDDCEFSPNFLEYMDKCLDAFEDDENVVAVTGYSYPIDWSVSEGATCMRQQFNVATWGLGRWVKKNTLVADYIDSVKMLDDAEMVIKAGRYKKMLEISYVQYFNQAIGGPGKKSLMNNVTDVSFRAYLACQDKYCISPILSKVRNYGFDGSGLYCQNTVGKDGSKALDYDYQNQEIDLSEHFDIVLNDMRLLPENKLKLDKFDEVSKGSLRLARLKFLIIKYFGLSFVRQSHKKMLTMLQAIGLKKRI